MSRQDSLYPDRDFNPRPTKLEFKSVRLKHCYHADSGSAVKVISAISVNPQAY